MLYFNTFKNKWILNFRENIIFEGHYIPLSYFGRLVVQKASCVAFIIIVLHDPCWLDPCICYKTGSSPTFFFGSWSSLTWINWNWTRTIINGLHVDPYGNFENWLLILPQLTQKEKKKKKKIWITSLHPPIICLLINHHYCEEVPLGGPRIRVNILIEKSTYVCMTEQMSLLVKILHNLDIISFYIN